MVFTNFLILFKSNEALKEDDEVDDSDEEEEYSPECGSWNEEESDKVNICGLVDESSFLNNKSKVSTRVYDFIDKMPKANSNASTVIKNFARMHWGGGGG